MKKLAFWIAVIIAAAWFINDPAGAAALASSAMHAITSATRALSAFTSHLH